MNCSLFWIKCPLGVKCRVIWVSLSLPKVVQTWSCRHCLQKLSGSLECYTVGTVMILEWWKIRLLLYIGLGHNCICRICLVVATSIRWLRYCQELMCNDGLRLVWGLTSILIISNSLVQILFSSFYVYSILLIADFSYETETEVLFLCLGLGAWELLA